MGTPKKRVIKNFDKIDEALKELINATYPQGYAANIITYDIGGGKLMSALPLETEEISYLIKFPIKEDVDETDDDMALGGEDDLDLEGGEDVDEEEEDDTVEKPVDNLDDLEVSDGTEP
ncbi:MAG: hypothetical protein K6G73_10910 [Marinilabiliaceae bacterium]|nr:hypothetical protein [Marinilabiliaceae bacterium]